MKNFNISLFLGCCVISLGIVIAGYLISKQLPPTISGHFTGTVAYPNNTSQYGEFLSEYEAAGLLMMITDDFITFIQSGELKGTYTVVQGNYVFSKEKLTQWAKNRIENE